jgi:hypothetical protein
MKGLDATVKKVEGIANNLKQEIKFELTDFAGKVVSSAKRTLAQPRGPHNSPTSNLGLLANSINWDVVGLDAHITVAKNYSAFIEFGTRKFAAQYVATLPQDWQQYAASFKGGGSGTFDQFVLAIYQWAKDRGIKPQPKQFEQGDSFTGAGGTMRKPRKKKKIDKEKELQQMAYLIARKIMVEGIRPQPFLYPAIQQHLPELKTRLKAIIK